MEQRVGLDSLADRGNDPNLTVSACFFHAAEPLALVRYLSLIDVMRRVLLNQVSRYSNQGGNDENDYSNNHFDDSSDRPRVCGAIQFAIRPSGS
jgi:hypothetical protein